MQRGDALGCADQSESPSLNPFQVSGMNVLRTFPVLALACVALAACSGLREDLGLGRSAPDEFAVVDRPPLSMPPDFGLRPPVPGAPRPQDVDLTARANETLFGTPDKAAGGTVSPLESSLIQQTGADKASPDIRTTINNESSQKVEASPHLVDRLLWWKPDTQPGTTVDAAAEAARIKDAQAKGEALNKSATPVIEQDKSGWLGL